MSDTKAVMATLIAGAALAGAAHAASAPSPSEASPASKAAVVEPQMQLESRREAKRKHAAPGLAEPAAGMPDVWLAKHRESRPKL